MIEKLLMQIGLNDQITKPLQGITKQVQSTMNAGKQGMQDMAVGGAGLVASGFAIQEALMPAIEMDRKIGEVKSLGVTDDALKQLTQTAFEFSSEYGKSATDFVAASYDIQSAIAGLDGNELSQFTKASGVLAAATKADTSTITSYMGTMYGIFKNQAEEMGKGEWVEQVAGMTASAVQMFKTTGNEMSAAFTSVGANATSAGIAMSEQMAILGTLQATMSGSEAGTKYKAFLAGVGTAQDKLNLKFTDAQGNMLPMLDILDKLKGKFGDTLEVTESDALKKAFGSEEAVSLIKLLMADTQGLAGSIEALGQVKGMTKAEEMAGAMTDQWERLEASWFAVRAAVFGAILPSINAVVGSMADGMVYLTGWTEEFPFLTQVLGYVAIGALALGGVVASLSLVMGIARMMSAGWAVTTGTLNGVLKLLRINTMAMTAATWLMNAALWANPITWVIAGIVALVAAVGAMIYWWDDLKAAFGDTAVFKFLADTIDWVIDKLNMIPGIDIEWRAGEMPEAPAMKAVEQVEKAAPPAIATLPDAATYQAQHPAMTAAPLPEQVSADDMPTAIQYKRPENTPSVPPSMVQTMTSPTPSQTSNIRQYGDVYIDAPNGMTPDQLAEWDELNAG
ncbi:phage tail tape measure protein [Photobacterium sp. 1_MG-2023]|uniref:phage tail tape measure protein n=1 Tax=Photobacterium sp. 1_MG-2023 TaxID=3062646 RepID=UPI0026E3B0BD|nr:phage tail tape measure protein [Photobacterium sp. 1_MG-2023]MDO6706140.1 phage tail tape measure protein [Photobacterium sp. 1_MG-2023]